MEPTPTDRFFAPYEAQIGDISRRLNEPVRKTLRQWDAESMLALAQSQRNRLFRMVLVLAALNAAQIVWQVMR